MSESTQVVRTGVIGLGGRGLYFARMYSESGHPGFSLRGVCDLDEKRLDVARQRFGDDLYTTTDMEELAARDDIDAVLVATSDPDHVPPTLTALAAGKHVMVEKPLCQTVEDARAVIDAARRSKGVFMIGFELRECTVFKKMKALIDEGRIGEVKIGHCFDNVSVGGNYFFHNPRRQKAFFRSLLLQKASHSLDLLNWFMGSEPARVYGTGGLDYYGGDADPELRCANCDRAGECPYRIDSERFVMDYGVTIQKPDYCVWSREMDLNDNSQLAITYANGGKATFHECNFTPEYSREFWLTGTKGKIYGYYDNPGRFLIRIEYSHDPDRRTEEWKPAAVPGAHGGGDNALRAEFHRRIVENDPPWEAIESAYYSTALAVCAEDSIESGQPVDIPPLKNSGTNA